MVAFVSMAFLCSRLAFGQRNRERDGREGAYPFFCWRFTWKADAPCESEAIHISEELKLPYDYICMRTPLRLQYAAYCNHSPKSLRCPCRSFLW